MCSFYILMLNKNIETLYTLQEESLVCSQLSLAGQHEHCNDCLESVLHVGVESLTEIDLQVLAIPGWRKPDLGTHKRHFSGRRAASCRRGRRDVADQLGYRIRHRWGLSGGSLL